MAILAGGVVLSLPISGHGHSVPFIDALFTSTSAVCVTGLVTVDTGTAYSWFGKLVVLLLIQMGGLGYMASSMVVVLLVGRRVSLWGRVLLREAHGQYDLRGMVRLTRYILGFTLVTEATGALLLTLRFLRLPELRPAQAVAFGIFHSVSAFCNAGFDLFGPVYGQFSSLTRFVRDVPVNLVITTLIVVGGLGFPVAMELTSRRKHRLSMHAKVVLTMTAALLVGGTAVIAIAEWTNPKTLGALPWPHRLLASYFQSVTPRTAGYCTLPIGNLHGPTLFFISMLMFVGTSPAGTGGGIKTTTTALIVLAALAALRGRQEPELFGRRLAAEQVYRALAVAVLAFLWVNLALLAMTFTEIGVLRSAAITEDLFIKLLFEVFSAFGTVGLSTGITPFLSPVGKAIIMLTMYVGRVGPVTAALIFLRRKPTVERTLPEERLLIG